MRDCLRQIYRQNGFLGLYHGVFAALPRVIVGSATQLTLYDKFKELANDQFGLRDGFPAHLFASFISSLFTVTIMNPFDVVSTRIYQSNGQQTVYHGVLDCIRKTVRTEGWTALQKGWLALYLRLGPHTVLTFIFLEKIRAWFCKFDALTNDSHALPLAVTVKSDTR
jgi:solute carrier family 25, member 34/35